MAGDNNAQILYDQVEIFGGNMHQTEHGRKDENARKNREDKIKGHRRSRIGTIVPVGRRHRIAKDRATIGDAPFKFC